jgi:hypothetical protein
MNISQVNISQMNSIQHAHYLTEQVAVVNRVKKHAQSSKIASHPRKKIAMILAGTLAFSPMARAALPQGLDVFNGMQEVSDSDLGHMRGKFASNDKVMYFGVEMVSQWLTPTGNLVTAGANLTIDFKGNGGSTPTVQYVPTVTIVQQGQGAPAPLNGNTNVVSGGAGLANVNGVSQSIQVAGQSNDIKNGIDMQVDISSAAQGGTIASAMQGQAGALSKTGDDGTVATVTLADNSIGVSVTVPGQGQVLQQIRNQGMFQSARIGGDLNQIHNAITMHIGLNAASGNAFGGAYAALQGLKSMPQNGMF